MRNEKKDTSPSDADLTPVDLPAEGALSSSAPPLPPQIDLSRYCEVTRRALYDIVVAVFFPPVNEEVRRFHQREGSWVEPHSPEESELVVFYLCGRWLASWKMLDEPEDAPANFRWEVLSIQERPGAPYGLGFVGV